MTHPIAKRMRIQPTGDGRDLLFSRVARHGKNRDAQHRDSHHQTDHEHAHDCLSSDSNPVYILVVESVSHANGRLTLFRAALSPGRRPDLKLPDVAPHPHGLRSPGFIRHASGAGMLNAI
jgi:hypothetical protein